jgi:glutamate dehydrogenase (NAD(P)+)
VALAPLLEVTWTDPVTERQGFLVIDRLVRGVCSGGLRMRAGCTLDEVRGLAAGMTRKEALYYRPSNRYVPLGGAKGGIDCDPHDPRMRGILTRFLQGMRVLLERHWTTGEDLGLQQKLIDEVITDIGMESSIQAVYPLLPDRSAATDRLRRAFSLDVDGIPLPDLSGGIGVAEAVLTSLSELGHIHDGTRAVIQGFGSMGGATARYLAKAGLRIVAVADRLGVIANPAGLDVELLLRSRNAFGEIPRSCLRPSDQQLPLASWLSVPTDVLVPAAVSYCITPANQHEVTASLIVEAANLPVLPAAESLLTARGVRVVPDFVANSATNAWWWWTLFGDIDASVPQAVHQIRTEMRRILTTVFALSRSTPTTLRQAALTFTHSQLATISTLP